MRRKSMLIIVSLMLVLNTAAFDGINEYRYTIPYYIQLGYKIDVDSLKSEDDILKKIAELESYQQNRQLLHASIDFIQSFSTEEYNENIKLLIPYSEDRIVVDNMYNEGQEDAIINIKCNSALINIYYQSDIDSYWAIGLHLWNKIEIPVLKDIIGMPIEEFNYIYGSSIKSGTIYYYDHIEQDLGSGGPNITLVINDDVIAEFKMMTQID